MPAYKQNLKNIQLNFKTHTDCNKMLNDLKGSDATPGFKSGLKIDKSNYKTFCDLLAYALSNSSSEVNKAKDEAISGPFFSGKLTDPSTFATELKKGSPEIAELVGETTSTEEDSSEPTTEELKAQKKKEQEQTTATQKRIESLKEALETAGGGSSEEAKEIKLKFSQVAALLRNKDFDQANVTLNEVDDLIKSIEPEEDEEEDDGEPLISSTELKKYMKKAAKDTPHPFACGIDKDGFYYTMNKPVKKPKALAKNIKTATGATKLCFGTAELDGKTLVLNLQKKPIPGMIRQMKKWLKANKPLPANKAKFVDEEGNEILPSPNEMAKELQEYNLRVTKALKDGGGEEIKAAWQTVVTKAKEKDFAAAWEALAALDELLDAATGEDEAKWLAEEAILSDLYEKAMKLNPENRTKLTAAWEMARENADGGNYTKALTIAARLKPALQAALETEDETDWGQVVKTAWQNAIETVDKQITKLQSALNASSDDVLVEIANFGLNGITGDFKVPLMSAILEIENETDEAQVKAAKKALKIIKKFRNHLDSEEVTAVDDNPFGVDVSVDDTLSTAFDQMEIALNKMVA